LASDLLALLLAEFALLALLTRRLLVLLIGRLLAAFLA
jgi:hypothetical protein